MCVGRALVSAKIEHRFGLKIGVIDSSQAVDVRVELAGKPIEPNIVRLENGPDLVILLLRDGIKHVVVAASTAKRDAKKSLSGMLDRFLEPTLPTEQFEIPHQESGGPKGVGILRAKLVRRQHFQDHPVIALILVQRLDDPIAPAPDVGLTVAHLIAPAGPVAVAPHIHPMPAPALTIKRASE